jgi:hypothetical protein
MIWIAAYLVTRPKALIWLYIWSGNQTVTVFFKYSTSRRWVNNLICTKKSDSKNYNICLAHLFSNKMKDNIIYLKASNFFDQINSPKMFLLVLVFIVNCWCFLVILNFRSCSFVCIYNKQRNLSVPGNIVFQWVPVKPLLLSTI